MPFLSRKKPRKNKLALVVHQYKCYSSLGKEPRKIDWGWLSTNPNAIPLLEKNLEKIALDLGFQKILVLFLS